MLIAIRPRKLFRWLLACIATLVCLHILAFWIAGTFPARWSELLWTDFDLSGERNVPALYSTSQLGIAAVVLFLLFLDARRAQPRDSGAWLALAGVFGFLAIDEYFMVHERFSKPVSYLLGAENVPLFSWVIPYSVLVAAFAVLFLRFWWRLPGDIRWKMALAASIYVCGGIGLELVGSGLTETIGQQTYAYRIEVIAEESMEMLGVALFIRTLAQLIQSRVGSLSLQFDTQAMDSHEQLMRDLETADRRKQERRAG